MKKNNTEHIVYLFQPSRYPSFSAEYDLLKHKDVKGSTFVCIETEEGSNFPDYKCGDYVTTTMELLSQHNWLGDLVYRCNKTEFHESL